MLNPILRESALRNGMPYIRQEVTHKGAACVVMAYSLDVPASVQLCPVNKAPAPGMWNTAGNKWVKYSECSISKADALFVEQISKMRETWMDKHKAHAAPVRKPMPPPSKPHKATNRVSRAKTKAKLKSQPE